MAEPRRIRTAGRPTYGRPVPARTRARRIPSFHLGLVPRRLIILVVVGFVALFGLWQLFKIHTVTIVPSSAQASLAHSAQQVVTSSVWLDNSLTFSPASFQSKFIAANPGIKTVQVTRTSPQSLRVAVVMKQPSLGWLSGSDGYILDADGTVIGSLPVGKQVVVEDDSNLPVATGQAVASARFVSFVMAVADQIPNTGLKPTKYEIKDTTLDLYVTTSTGYQLIFDTSRAVGDEVGDLKLVLANLKQTGKTPTQYIDLRIPGRAYYK